MELIILNVTNLHNGNIFVKDGVLIIRKELLARIYTTVNLINFS